MLVDKFLLFSRISHYLILVSHSLGEFLFHLSFDSLTLLTLNFLKLFCFLKHIKYLVIQSLNCWTVNFWSSPFWFELHFWVWTEFRFDTLISIWLYEWSSFASSHCDCSLRLLIDLRCLVWGMLFILRRYLIIFWLLIRHEWAKSSCFGFTYIEFQMSRSFNFRIWTFFTDQLRYIICNNHWFSFVRLPYST